MAPSVSYCEILPPHFQHHPFCLSATRSLYHEVCHVIFVIVFVSALFFCSYGQPTAFPG